MAPSASRFGIGATITFTVSGFEAIITSADLDFGTRDEIDVTHLGSTTVTGNDGNVQAYEEVEPGPNKGGSMTLNVKFAPEDTLPLDEGNESIEVLWPAAAGESSREKYTRDGHIQGAPVAIPWDNHMTATITIRWSGAPEWSTV